MQTLELQNVEIESGFSFRDPETGISIKGSCSVDNQTRKVKKLQGSVYAGESNLIGSVAANTTADGRTFHTVSPYDMEDSVRMATVAKALFESLEQYDYTPAQAEEAQNAGEGVDE